jgi:hypothetical protein
MIKKYRHDDDEFGFPGNLHDHQARQEQLAKGGESARHPECGEPEASYRYWLQAVESINPEDEDANQAKIGAIKVLNRWIQLVANPSIPRTQDDNSRLISLPALLRRCGLVELARRRVVGRAANQVPQKAMKRTSSVVAPTPSPGKLDSLMGLFRRIGRAFGLI